MLNSTFDIYMGDGVAIKDSQRLAGKVLHALAEKMGAKDAAVLLELIVAHSETDGWEQRPCNTNVSKIFRVTPEIVAAAKTELEAVRAKLEAQSAAADPVIGCINGTNKVDDLLGMLHEEGIREPHVRAVFERLRAVGGNSMAGLIVDFNLEASKNAEPPVHAETVVRVATEILRDEQISYIKTMMAREGITLEGECLGCMKTQGPLKNLQPEAALETLRLAIKRFNEEAVMDAILNDEGIDDIHETVLEKVQAWEAAQVTRQVETTAEAPPQLSQGPETPPTAEAAATPGRDERGGSIRSAWRETATPREEPPPTAVGSANVNGSPRTKVTETWVAVELEGEIAESFSPEQDLDTQNRIIAQLRSASIYSAVQAGAYPKELRRIVDNAKPNAGYLETAEQALEDAELKVITHLKDNAAALHKTLKAALKAGEFYSQRALEMAVGCLVEADGPDREATLFNLLQNGDFSEPVHGIARTLLEIRFIEEIGTKTGASAQVIKEVAGFSWEGEEPTTALLKLREFAGKAKRKEIRTLFRVVAAYRVLGEEGSAPAELRSASREIRKHAAWVGPAQRQALKAVLLRQRNRFANPDEPLDVSPLDRTYTKAATVMTLAAPIAVAMGNTRMGVGLGMAAAVAIGYATLRERSTRAAIDRAIDALDV